MGRGNGRDDWIRTSDLTHPKRTLYQAEPRPVEAETTRAERAKQDGNPKKGAQRLREQSPEKLKNRCWFFGSRFVFEANLYSA